MTDSVTVSRAQVVHHNDYTRLWWCIILSRALVVHYTQPGSGGALYSAGLCGALYQGC